MFWIIQLMEKEFNPKNLILILQGISQIKN